MATDPEYFYFNIHNLVKMRITASHPCAYSIRHSYQPFQVEQLDECDLTLSENMLLLGDYSDASTAYKFGHGCTRINARMVDVALRGDKLFLSGKRDLLPFVGPLVHWQMLRRGATTIHGASVAVNGRGILMPAWGGTGKTSAIVELLKLSGSAFMGDDFAIIREDGMLLSYPKPFFIYPYHREVFPHLFKHKPKLLVPSWMSNFVAVVRRVVRPRLAAFPRLESLCRRLTPEHMQIPARRALPHANFVDNAPVKLIVYFERYNGSEPVVDRLDPAMARRRVVGNHYFELGIYAQELMTACAATGLLGFEDWFGEMSKVVDKVFGRLPIYRLRIPPMKPRLTGKTIASMVNELLPKPQKNQARHQFRDQY